jgi:excisionase family DNA binding protein
MARKKDPNVMNVHEAATFFGVTPYTIREWLKSGKLKGSKPGKSWRIERRDAHDLAQTNYGSDD